MVLDVTALYDEELLTYTLRYAGGSEGGTTTVLRPETLSGITMEASRDVGRLLYDGTVLETGDIGSAGLTPAGIGTMLWILWTEGYASQCRFEMLDDRDTVACRLDGEDGVSADMWFARDTGAPLYCEALSYGAVVLRCEIAFEQMTNTESGLGNNGSEEQNVG